MAPRCIAPNPVILNILCPPSKYLRATWSSTPPECTHFPLECYALHSHPQTKHSSCFPNPSKLYLLVSKSNHYLYRIQEQSQIGPIPPWIIPPYAMTVRLNHLFAFKYSINCSSICSSFFIFNTKALLFLFRFFLIQSINDSRKILKHLIINLNTWQFVEILQADDRYYDLLRRWLDIFLLKMLRTNHRHDFCQ
jgi:hypothetical protein